MLPRTCASRQQRFNREVDGRAQLRRRLVRDVSGAEGSALRLDRSRLVCGMVTMVAARNGRYSDANGAWFAPNRRKPDGKIVSRRDSRAGREGVLLCGSFSSPRFFWPLSSRPLVRQREMSRTSSPVLSLANTPPFRGSRAARAAPSHGRAPLPLLTRALTAASRA